MYYFMELKCEFNEMSQQPQFLMKNNDMEFVIFMYCKKF